MVTNNLNSLSAAQLPQQSSGVAQVNQAGALPELQKEPVPARSMPPVSSRIADVQKSTLSLASRSDESSTSNSQTSSSNVSSAKSSSALAASMKRHDTINTGASSHSVVTLKSESEAAKGSTLWSTVKKVGIAIAEKLGFTDKVNREHPQYARLKETTNSLQLYYVQRTLYPHENLHLGSEQRTSIGQSLATLKDIKTQIDTTQPKDARTQALSERTQRWIAFTEKALNPPPAREVITANVAAGVAVTKRPAESAPTTAAAAQPAPAIKELTVDQKKKAAAVQAIADTPLAAINKAGTDLQAIPFGIRGDKQPLESITKDVPDRRVQDKSGNTVPVGVAEPSFQALQASATPVNPKPARIGGTTGNTYPKNSEGAHVHCDVLHVEAHAGVSFSVIADGNNWGKKPRQAAQRAVATFSSEFRERLVRPPPIKNVEEAGRVLVQGFAKAHQAIIQDKNTTEEAGSTTLSVTIDYEEKAPDGTINPKIIFGGVGDSKAFVITQDESGAIQSRDLTANARLESLQHDDPGGRLGPDENWRADTRNMALSVTDLPKNGRYMVIHFTDGVHDNLDPRSLALSFDDVRAVGVKFEVPSGIKDWDDLKHQHPQLYAKISSEYQQIVLSGIVQELMQELKRAPTPQEVTDRLVDYSYRVTNNARTGAESSLQFNLKKVDRKMYPGKPDHATVTAQSGKTSFVVPKTNIPFHLPKIPVPIL